VPPQGRSRRILGIDPGSRVTGYGLIESDGLRSRHLASGCVRVADQPWPQRLGDIFQGLLEVVRSYRPQEVAVEQVFFSRNPAAALKLGQARGAAICAALSAGVTVHEYSPRAVKQAVVGSGGAEKAQVEHMVRIILSLQGELVEDQADALAVAICHAHTLGRAGSWPGAGP
jgi:crossover junction endodeoxyribonuclease RuvC